MKNLQYFLALLVIIGGFCFIPAFAAATDLSDAADTFSVGSINGTSFGDEFSELLKSAADLYAAKKYDEALAACTKAAELSPRDYRPHYFAGAIYMAQMKLKSASEEFAKSIALNPNFKRNYLLKAQADSRRGAPDEAIATCRQALKIDPSFAEAYAMIGETLKFDEKRRAEAIEAYRSAIELNPQFFSAYQDLGDVLEDSKDEKGAEEMFRKGMAADPKAMAGRFQLGRLLVKQGRLTEARAVWEARTSDEDNTFPNFIELLERAENLKTAKDLLAKKPNDPEALVGMGNAVMDGDSWVVDGRQERAVVYFKKALKIKPGFLTAQYGICKAYIQIADTFEEKNKIVDAEMAKMKRLSPKLAKELEDYRKDYSGGLKGGPPIDFNK